MLSLVNMRHHAPCEVRDSMILVADRLQENLAAHLCNGLADIVEHDVALEPWLCQAICCENNPSAVCSNPWIQWRVGQPLHYTQALSSVLSER
jgi:hypothetical protein